MALPQYFQISLQPRKSANLFMLIVFILSGGCAGQLAEYDFIIVGGGAAGSLLASRLSEVSEWSVLLIEAGGEESVLEDIPLFAAHAQLTPINWGYKTEPSSTACLGLVGGQCNWPRGKVLGGSSVLNYMVYTRGNRKDYDDWAEEGSEGWGYDDVLPYFLRSEDMLIPRLAADKRYHSTKGELPITHPPYHTQAASDFIEAGVETGYNEVDYNAASQIGYSFHQCTMKDGMRVSANRAFLEPARTRRNLYVLKNSLVTKILVHPENQTAYGVEYELWSVLPRRARARKEVIISAGAINSPQLLMLSGIGPKDDLEKLGISVMQDSKVGFNLQDHISLGNLYFTANSTIGIPPDYNPNDVSNVIKYLQDREGPLSIPAGTEAFGFEDIDDNDGFPEIEIIFSTSTTSSLNEVGDAWGVSPDIYENYESLADENSFMMLPVLMHPKSRGRLTLRSRNPMDKPLLYHNYLTEPEDVNVLIKGIRRAIRLTDTAAFQRHGVQLLKVPLPPCEVHEFGSDEYWECSIRYMTFTFYHQCGTCKMGPDSDEDAVVDPQLRVRGIKNLRVVDSSIIPVIISGHLVAPTYMIAEKASDMIKNHWNATSLS
ncbi:glucose dehydrogenase [FAD, quinone]-like isoform X2 [Zootermopsis nevadensis]|uniref:glucose dehydrogenase [FAD, quinone]-like isoform X2 n=1 Tax=Zootermopsis nevadensis TaxID=136037 RepID=UPI000B8E26EB|nr:glucose dehydrogenase [FAD, quinone]-like isoform X2 [Zootermopsis nevadensis]